MPTEHNPETFSVDLRHVLVANAVSFCDANIPAETCSRYPGWPESGTGPGLLLQFNCLGIRPVNVFLPRAAMDDEFAEGMAKVLAAVNDDDLQAASALHNVEINRQKGVFAQSDDVRCPGCNARLFGEVAARGGCTACFPPLPEAGE